MAYIEVVHYNVPLSVGILLQIVPLSHIIHNFHHLSAMVHPTKQIHFHCIMYVLRTTLSFILQSEFLS